VVSQSSSRPLQTSVGTSHAPQSHPESQVLDPSVPHVVTQSWVVPEQHVKPSSQVVLQSSSMPLQTSAGTEQTLHPHAPLHVREPVEPQLVVHDSLEPAQQANVSSQDVSQSSSIPLQASMGGTHAPQSQAGVHVRTPAVPQALVQLPEVPGMHVSVSSIRPSQSSSFPLQDSAGAEHAPNVHVAPHVLLPVEPQLVVQEPIAPGLHSLVSSTPPSQSSSTPLQPSAGGLHAPSVQLPLQVREPVDPQLVVQLIDVPREHPKSSSTMPSQSSSRALQVSMGAEHAVHEQSARQVRAPVDPQLVVQLSLAPWTHANTSSGAPLQSSSTALQISAGGAHTSHEHVPAHTRVPVVPHVVMHEPISPRQHVKGSSQPRLQSSSIPLQTSGAIGLMSGLVSLQSVAATPPVSGQAESPNPSRSTSRVVWTHIPRIASSHWSLVHVSPSLQSVGVPGAQAIASQVSTPLHMTMSAHSISSAHARGGQPAVMSQVVPSMQSPSSGSFLHVPSSQRSSVHATPSSHMVAAVQPVSGTPVSGIPISVPESMVPASGMTTCTQVPS